MSLTSKLVNSLPRRKVTHGQFARTAGSSSTPHVVRVSASSKADKRSEVPLLKGELNDHVVDGMDFGLFVREVCKLPDRLCQRIEEAIQSNEFGLASEWEQFVGAVSAVRLGEETKIYAPLIQLYDWICGRLSNVLDVSSETGLCFKDTSNTPLRGSPAMRKPDITGVSRPMDHRTPSWKDVLVCWEVKHTQKRSAQDQLEEPPRKKSRSSGNHSKSFGDEDANEQVSDSSHSALDQLASYLLEMISAQPHRRSTIGVLLCQWQLQLVFHTRSFIVVTEPFDIRYDRIKLTVAVAALWTANLQALGFDPHFIGADGSIAVRPDGCLVTVGDQTHSIGETLFKARSLFGRGTASFGTLGEVAVVIKINCPPKSREVEAKLLDRARDIRNIIKVTASTVWGSILDGFSPEFIKFVAKFEDREFRALVLSPVCVPFTSVTEIGEFKRSFCKLVIAHHELYKLGILHCDISVGNLMYDPVEKEPYLIDVDLGKSVSKLDSPSSNHRTGTLPFMATDLLVENPPQHRYRHDLESFFYVLVWICVPDHCGWDTVYSTAGMREKKSDFFTATSGNPIDRLRLHAEFEPLRATWIRELHILFMKGRRAVEGALLGFGEEDIVTWGGYITYRKFMEVLEDSS